MSLIYIMDSMLGENNNLKDSQKDSLKDTFSMPSVLVPSLDKMVSYTKTNKLITALYMVTDTMEKEEPIRLKLRTLGVEILSDTASLQKGSMNSLVEKVSAILSFLNIAFDVGMISEMNSNILRKEFMELNQSVKDFNARNHQWLEEFVMRPSLPSIEESLVDKNNSIGHQSSESLSFNKGHSRIGVQKGSTLMNALNRFGEKHTQKHSHHTHESKEVDAFEILKNKRREEIIAIIEKKRSVNSNEGATITDIKKEAKGTLSSCSEKTLQRELISMVKDNVLYKKGDKRWSQYFLSR